MEGYVWSLKEDTVDIEFLLHNKQEERHFKGFKMVNLDHSFINLKPPTLIKTNEFSKPYQDIVDSYGIPNYKEIILNSLLLLLSHFSLELCLEMLDMVYYY